MKKWYRLNVISFAVISSAALIVSTQAFASPTPMSSYAYVHAIYDDGYDDGYDDAMDDCPCWDELDFFDGWYFGAGIGYDSYSVKRTLDISPDLFATQRLNSNGWNGSILGGYGHLFQPTPHGNFFLGGEVFLGSSNADGKETINSNPAGVNASENFTPRTSFGFNLRPGFKFNHLPLTYLNLGVVRTDLKGSATLNGMTWNTERWRNGFQYGVGLESPIDKKFSFRVDYNRIDYGSFSSSNYTKVETSDNQFKLTGIYHF